jgi:hypothetical protein
MKPRLRDGRFEPSIELVLAALAVAIIMALLK